MIGKIYYFYFFPKHLNNNNSLYLISFFSKYYGALFNLFGSRGCFDAILRRLSVPVTTDRDVGDDMVLVSSTTESKSNGSLTRLSSSSPPRLSLDELSHLVKILTKPSQGRWYVHKFQENYFPKFQVAVFNRLSSLSNDELQKFDQSKLQNILSSVEKLLLETLDNFSGTSEKVDNFMIYRKTNI